MGLTKIKFYVLPHLYLSFKFHLIQLEIFIIHRSDCTFDI